MIVQISTEVYATNEIIQELGRGGVSDTTKCDRSCTLPFSDDSIGYRSFIMIMQLQVIRIESIVLVSVNRFFFHRYHTTDTMPC